jgi:2,3-bisphosphoglycerate-dependent phosphoglycerate mutase
VNDLHCPARVYVARHGEAEYETGRVSNDGGSLSALGRRQARELGESLRGQRVARVWCSSLARAVQTAEISAAVLGTDVVVREGLREYAVGDLTGSHASGAAHFEAVFRQWAEGDDAAQISGGERVADTVARIQATLQEIADQHRGEAVLVVSHGGAMLASLPPLAGLPRTYGLGVSLGDCAVIELEAGGDGWRAVSWCGEPL